MFSENERISSLQIKKLLIFDIISISIIILPGIAASVAGRDGLIAMLLGGALAILYGLFFIYASDHVGDNYIEFVRNATGRLSYVFGALYIVKIIFSCWFSLGLFSKIINDTLLPDTNIKVIVFTLILISIYGASKGIEVRARIAEVFFLIVIAPLVLLFIFGINRIELANLLPLFISDGNQILSTGYLVLLVYSAIEITIFSIPALAKNESKKSLKKSVVYGIIIALSINISLFILAAGVLGNSITAQHMKAFIMITQTIQIPGGLLQRQDAIMLTIWMLSIFVILMAYFLYLTDISDNFYKIKNKNKYLIFYGILLFLLGLIVIPIENLFSLYGKYMIFIGFPQSVLIPLIVIFVSKMKVRKK